MESAKLNDQVVNYILYDIKMTEGLYYTLQLDKIVKRQKKLNRGVGLAITLSMTTLLLLIDHIQEMRELRKEIKKLKSAKGE